MNEEERKEERKRYKRLRENYIGKGGYFKKYYEANKEKWIKKYYKKYYQKNKEEISEYKKKWYMLKKLKLKKRKKDV